MDNRQAFWMAAERALTKGPGLDEYARQHGLAPLYWVLSRSALVGQVNTGTDDHEALRAVQAWADHLRLVPVDGPMKGTAEYEAPRGERMVNVWGVIDRDEFEERSAELNRYGRERNTDEEKGSAN